MEGIPYKIAMISDVPHILKNIRNGLLKNKVFTIDDKYVHKYNLKTNEVRLSTIQKVVDIQKDMELKIAPHLKPLRMVVKTHIIDKGMLALLHSKILLKRSHFISVRGLLVQ